MRNVRIMGFDLDGTLVRMKLDLGSIRRELNIPGQDILSHIESLPAEEGDRLLKDVEAREIEAARNAEPMQGALELLSLCRSRGIKVVIITRNSQAAAKETLDTLGAEADMIVSRESAPPKPSPEAINLVLNQYGARPEEMAFVGDYIYDVQAGNAAGVRTILLTTQERSEEWAPFADLVVEDLFEVIDLLKESGPHGRS